ncbi:MAG TPA: hypothetical protein VGM90_32550 [Kofleriaceae bacterium]|jgi:hypothetical protein
MKNLAAILFAATSVVACVGSAGDGTTGGDDGGSGSDTGSGSGMTNDQWDQLLGQRVVDYNAALRTAAIRLTGDLPTMDEINSISTLTDVAAQKTAYETLLTAYLARPTFAKQMMGFWQDTFKMGGGTMNEMDTAPAFAAMLSVNDGSYMDLFTAQTGNCPTFDGTTFTAGTCAGSVQAGVLANPGAMKQFFSNFAFRRVRWVQETFDCAKFPIEVGAAQDVHGAAPYNGVWPFESISDDQVGRVNFRDVSAVVCANCHQTINHIAPLFAYFDDQGAMQTAISVPTPLDGAPKAELTDYLPATETTAWRYQKPATTIPALGAAMAADPAVAKCGVARIWNWALGKMDIVDTLTDVPQETIQAQQDAFTSSGFKLKQLIFAVYSSDDFVKF